MLCLIQSKVAPFENDSNSSLQSPLDIAVDNAETMYEDLIVGAQLTDVQGEQIVLIVIIVYLYFCDWYKSFLFF
jgi:hypothetical protein